MSQLECCRHQPLRIDITHKQPTGPIAGPLHSSCMSALDGKERGLFPRKCRIIIVNWAVDP